MTARITIKSTAQTRCDKSRAKSPLAHVRWSLGDKPCKDCMAWARAKLKKDNK